MRLPNGDRALVPLEKLTEYCLNDNHPRGLHKARVFAAALGITSSSAEFLQSEILAAAVTGEAVATETDEYGQRFMLDFVMEGSAGPTTVRSLWIVRHGEDFPRLTSCYVL